MSTTSCTVTIGIYNRLDYASIFILCKVMGPMITLVGTIFAEKWMKDDYSQIALVFVYFLVLFLIAIFIKNDVRRINQFGQNLLGDSFEKNMFAWNARLAFAFMSQFLCVAQVTFNIFNAPFMSFGCLLVSIPLVPFFRNVISNRGLMLIGLIFTSVGFSLDSSLMIGLSSGLANVPVMTEIQDSINIDDSEIQNFMGGYLVIC